MWTQDQVSSATLHVCHMIRQPCIDAGLQQMIRNRILQAQAKLDATPGINNLAFIHSTVEDADFEPASLDLVLCHNGMWYFQDHHKVLSLIRSWLKPGGRFVYNVMEVGFHSWFLITRFSEVQHLSIQAGLGFLLHSLVVLLIHGRPKFCHHPSCVLLSSWLDWWINLDVVDQTVNVFHIGQLELYNWSSTGLW